MGCWDYITFLVIAILVVAGLGLAIFVWDHLAASRLPKRMFDNLAKQQAVREEDVEPWLTRVNAAQATTDGAVASLERANVHYKSEINGVNATVANIEAQLHQALYYFDNTTLTAQGDGRIINLQVRPGMVSGIYRIGGIAALIADANRYVPVTCFQKNLKYVRPGQPGFVRQHLDERGSIFQATKFRNSNRLIRTFPRASTRSKLFSTIPISLNFQSARRDRRRSTQIRPLSRATQNFDPRPLLVQLGLSN